MNYRYDLARWTLSTELTPQGFLRAPAVFTRVGVFEYRRADGSTVRELRSEDEVFAPASLDTLRAAPVVVGNPSDREVTPLNACSLAKGWAGEQVDRSDGLLTGTITVMDAGTISKIRQGDLKEISMGYVCSIEVTPGSHPTYGRYDQIQRNIRYNHVAIGPEGWGRAGPEVSIRLDSGDAVCTDIAGVANVGQSGVLSDSHQSKPRADGGAHMTVKITIGGVDYEVPKSAGQAITQDHQRRDTEIAGLTKAREAAEGRYDAAKAEIEKLQKDLEEFRDPARLDSAVADRVALLDSARKILGTETEIKGTKRAIMEQALRHDNADLDLSDRSDDYVEARFDALVEAKPAEPAPKVGSARREIRRDSGVRTSEQARQEMLERNAKAWEQPLATTRQN